MNEYVIENAVIKGTRLGVNFTDHGILSFRIDLEFAGSGQAFGMIELDDYDPVKEKRVPALRASSLLLAIDKIWGVDWEDLKGIPVRAYKSSTILAIGHFFRNEWLWFNRETLEFVVTTLKELEASVH
jgi:hypothetical protein